MIIGIDFGTTKSVAAVFDAGRPVAIPCLEGHRSMPSVVMVAPDQRLYVGWDALTHPSRYEGEHFTISSIKRRLGNTGETEWGHLRTYPQEIAALILGRLKVQAEAYCGADISEAIIAVPAHFDINQRWATMQAAEIAGLKALRLLNEATGAVLAAHSLLPERKEGVALVFDFGGGTLDVSIVQFGEGVYEVIATAGDDRLGGDDIDQTIMDFLMERARAELGVSLQLSSMHELVLKEAARRAKIDLSSALATNIYLPGFLPTASGYRDLDFWLDRATLESLCAKLFDRAIAVLQRAVGDARGTPLTEVILTGGTSRIPRVRESVRRVAGLNPSAGIDPEVGVSEGAAIVAATFSGALRNVLLLDVVPSTYSVAVKGDVASVIVPRNTTIPTNPSFR